MLTPGTHSADLVQPFNQLKKTYIRYIYTSHSARVACGTFLNLILGIF